MVAGDIPPARKPTATVHEALGISGARVQTGASVTSFFQGLGKPVAYYPVFAAKLGGVTPAVMFCQLSYWYRIEALRDWDGWIYKTSREMYDETGLTRREQETARAKLTERSVIETKVKGVPAKMHYKIRWEAFEALWQTESTEAPNQYGGNVQTGMAESAKLSIQRIHQETTTENLPVATLPAKPSLYRVFSDLFEERSGQKWSIDGKKEGANLAALVKWAKEMAPDGWEQYLRSFMDGAWALIHGDVLGLKASEREWWMSKPYTPSMLRSLRPHIVATMLAMESNNTASKEYMEQLEKDWGTKIRKRQALEAK